MIRVGIVGTTGYGGRELARLLGTHPRASLAQVTSTSAAGRRLDEELPAFGGLTDLEFEPFDAAALAESCDVVFVGVPGAESLEIVSQLRVADARVIDIGPDFRLHDTDAFKQYYGKDHTAASLLGEAVYGCVPFNRAQLTNARLVAVPGCYPIGCLVPLKPLVDIANIAIPIVVDAVSGLSGAGKSLNERFHFPELNENVWAYKVGVHQHTPEIEQELGNKAMVQFSPHVGPFTRGILSTITVRCDDPVDLAACYRCYEDEPFVRVLGEGGLPELNNVRGSNFCDFGWVDDKRTGNLVIISAIDNLVGGTAGMAIQCMNIMFGLDETAGLGLAGMSV